MVKDWCFWSGKIKKCFISKKWIVHNSNSGILDVRILKNLIIYALILLIIGLGLQDIPLQKLMVENPT